MMVDKQKVIKGLECCAYKKNCNECPYFKGNATCMDDKDKDALELLKEQEPKKVEWRIGRAHCPSCGELFPRKKETQYIRFCSFCGQAVTWE